MDTPFSALEVAERAAEALWERTGLSRLDALIVLGTGLGPTAELLGAKGPPIELVDLPGFQPPTVIGHRAHAWSVNLAGQHTLVVGGRVHLYEGRTESEVVHLVRTAVLAGCKIVMLTTAAGGIRPGFSPGEIVMISDHLNMTGRSALIDVPADHPLGSPFVDLTDAWSPRLRAAARSNDPSIAQGVYAQLLGPQFETPAEIRMLEILGADLVGMSTVLEATAARHLGAEVLGLAVVTNPAAGRDTSRIEVDEILASAASARTSLADLLRGALNS